MNDFRLVISGAGKTVREQLAEKPWYRNHIDAMITPFTGNAPEPIIAMGLKLVCDNGCFPGPGKKFGFDPVRFLRMLDRISGCLRHVRWVSVPDFVERLADGTVRGDAEKTRTMFDEWAPQMEARGVPLAYVLQDGVASSEIPWDRIRAVFVGGSDEFKLGLPAPWLNGKQSIAELVAEAKRRGKLVHMGRVNSIKRLKYSLAVGADSCDGTSTSMFPRIKIPFFVDALVGLKKTLRETAVKLTNLLKCGRSSANQNGENVMKGKKSVNADRDPVKLREYRKRHYEKKKAERLAASGGTPAPVGRPPMAPGLREIINKTQAQITDRASRLVKEAMTSGVETGKSVAEIAASFADAAGNDPESEALLRLLHLLGQAEDLRKKIAAKDFAPVKAPAPRKKKA